MENQASRIYQIDKNFTPPATAPQDIEYYSVLEPQFSLHGLAPVQADDPFLRLPREVATATSEGVAYLSKCTAGGRVRFATNSSVIVIKYKLREKGFMGHMAKSGSCGADVYASHYRDIVGNGLRVLTIIPQSADALYCEGIKDFYNSSKRDITINLPLYNGITEMYVGVKAGSEFFEPTPYMHQKPVVFYGSSITQGGCASRPGNAYFAILGRMLDCDYYCLGFSGNAMGERVMAEYIGKMEMSALVYDYDHNAPDIKHLKGTHYSFYETIRAQNPSSRVPILFVSKPDFEASPENAERRDVVLESYLKAKGENGKDKYVSFVDGETLFGSSFRDECTVDGCHPNDLGFCKMAETIYPKLKAMLEQF